MFKGTLSQYYKTKHWREFRLSITSKDNCKCEMCGRNRWDFYKVGKRKGLKKPKPVLRISIHHKHYRTLSNESRTDVLAVCNKCHDTMHNLHTMSQWTNQYKFVYDKLCRSTPWEHEKRSK